jgi:hypothetical protein
MYKHPIGLVLRGLITDEGIEADRLAGFDVIPRIGPRRRIYRFQNVEGVRPDSANLVRVDRVLPEDSTVAIDGDNPAFSQPRRSFWKALYWGDEVCGAPIVSNVSPYSSTVLVWFCGFIDNRWKPLPELE